FDEKEGAEEAKSNGVLFVAASDVARDSRGRFTELPTTSVLMDKTGPRTSSSAAEASPPCRRFLKPIQLNSRSPERRTRWKTNWRHGPLHREEGIGQTCIAPWRHRENQRSV